MIFLGYDEETKDYRCLDYTCWKIIIFRDVICDKTHVGIPDQRELSLSDDNILKAFLDLNTHVQRDNLFLLSQVPQLVSDPLTNSQFPPILTTSHPTIPSFQDFSPLNLSQSSLQHTEPDHIPIIKNLQQPVRHFIYFEKQSIRLDDYISLIILDDFDIYFAKICPNLIGDNILLSSLLTSKLDSNYEWWDWFY